MSQEPRTNEAFISYSRADEDYVKQLIAILRQKGLDPWFDAEDIPKGADWWHEIKKGIEGVYAFVFVISPSSLSSQVCNWELAYAIENNKKIVPVMHVDVSDDVLSELSKMVWNDPSGKEIVAQKNREILYGLNFIFLRTAEDLETGSNELITTVRTDLDYVDLHTRLLQRAKEWVEKDSDTSFLLTGAGIAEAEGWMVRGITQEISPTPLHVEYIATSRSYANRRHKRLLQLTIAGVGSIAILILFGVLQTNTAQRRENERATQEAIARTEAASRITQQAIAEREGGITHGLGLVEAAAQSYEQGDFDLALLLALEANNMESPPFEAQRELARISYAPGTMHYIDGGLYMGILGAITISPDGRLVLGAWGHFSESGAQESIVYLWDIVTGEELLHSAPVTGWVEDEGIAFSRDGLIAQARYRDEYDVPSLYYWDIITGQELSADEPRISSSEFVTETDVSSIIARHAIPTPWDNLNLRDNGLGEGGFPSQVLAVAVEPQARLAATGHGNAAFFEQGSVRIWDVSQGEIRRFEGHTKLVSSLGISLDGQLGVSGSADGTVRVWDLGTGEQVDFFETHTPVEVVRFDPNSLYIASGGADGSVRVWDVQSGDIIWEFQHGFEPIFDISFASDGQAIWVANEYALIALDIETHSLLQQKDFGGGNTPWDSIYEVAFVPQSQQVLVGSQGVAVWNMETDEWGRLEDTSTTYLVTNLVVSDDGSLVIDNEESWNLSHPAAGLKAWNMQTSEWLNEFGAESIIQAISPDNRIAVASLGDTLLFWDIETGEEVRRIENIEVSSAAFDPEGRFLLTGLQDGGLRQWRVTLSIDELIDWTCNNRYVREFTSAEQEAYGITPIGSVCSD